MTKIYLPYENHEALTAAEFFRDLGKAADAEDLAILDEDCRVSDFPSDPCAKLLGLPEIFDRPVTEQKTALRKDVKTSVTKIGDAEVIAELNERGEVTRTYVKGTR
jgi:hypothetical protein